MFFRREVLPANSFLISEHWHEGTQRSPETGPSWLDVVRDGRILMGSAPGQARRRLVTAAA